MKTGQTPPKNIDEYIACHPPEIQEKLEKIILPTEFQNLKDFQTFLKIANYGITRMETPRKFLPTVAPEFLPRDFGLEQMLKDKAPPLPAMRPAEVPQFAP